MDTAVQPWIACQDLLLRIKAEIAMEAIDSLHAELEAKRLDFKGTLPVQEGESAEHKRDMLMIANIMENWEEMDSTYTKFIKDGEVSSDPAVVARVEELRRLLLSLSKIRYLMLMVDCMGEWLLEIGNPANRGKQAAELLLLTARGHAEREEALRYSCSNREFIKSGAINSQEAKMISELGF